MEPIQVGKYKFEATINESNSQKVKIDTKIGGKTYSITASFKQPMDQNKIEQYLKQKSTIEKMDLLINKYQLISNAYSHKAFANVKLTSKGEEDKVSVDYKKIKSNKEETKFLKKNKSFVMDATKLEKKIEKLEIKKKVLEKQCKATLPTDDLKQKLEQKEKLELLTNKLKSIDRRIETINQLKTYVIADFRRMNEDEKKVEKEGERAQFENREPKVKSSKKTEDLMRDLDELDELAKPPIIPGKELDDLLANEFEIKEENPLDDLLDYYE